MPSVLLSTGKSHFQPIKISDEIELRTSLKELRRENLTSNFLVRLVKESGEELMLGFGQKWGNLTITSADGSRVIMALAAKDKPEQMLEFYFGSHYYEWDPEHLIPLKLAIAITSHWIADTEADASVQWEVIQQPVRFRR